MDPTSLPTDNLYKFMALAGLAFTGFFGWLYWKVADARSTRSLAVEEGTARLRAQLAGNQARLARLSHENESFGAGHSAAENEAQREVYTQQLIRVGVDIAANARDTVEINKELQVLLTRAKAFEPGRLQRATNIAMIAAMVGGLGVSVVGFMLWQSRFQRFADEQTQIELKLKQLELKQKAEELKRQAQKP